MLSQFKSRELVPAQTEESSKQEPVAVALQITKSFDEEQQAAARLTCDALCSLANGTNATSTTTAPSPAGVATPLISIALPSQPLLMHGFVPQNAIAPPTATARVLSPPKTLSTITTKSTGATTISSPASNSRASTKIKACPKQHQLPLFLSKTYHMIDRCDPDVATWSATGDNFVVKNVEMFASTVLPMYFKHSNFSSFARQLNFYGFRKLRSDPILTNDVDPQTAAYVRFYHEKFQKDRPELLHSIKRATKSDQQSKDDVDDLKSQVFKLKKCVLDMSTQMERKISEMNYEYNRKINCLRAEYEKLTGLVAQLLQQQHHQFSQSSSPQQHQQQQHQQQQHQQQHILPKHVASPLSSHRVHDVPNPPLPPVVETTTSIPNISSATTSVNTCNSGGLSTTTATISSSSLSSNTTATPPHTITSQTMGQEQQQQQKMQSLSHVVAMSLMESSSLSSNTTATPPHTITSQTMGQEQQQQQKMQSLSHAVAMGLMENATTLLAPASDAYLNPGTTPSAEGGSSSNKRAHSDGVTTTGNAPPTVRVRTD